MTTEPLDPLAEALLDEAAARLPEYGSEAVDIPPEELRRRWEAGESLHDIAEHFGVVPATIEWRLIRLGLKQPRPGIDWLKVRTLWGEGKSIREIAREANASPTAVRYILSQPEENVGPSIRRSQVLAWAQKGLTQPEIAQKVGLSHQDVSRILLRAGPNYGSGMMEARHQHVLDLHDTGRTPAEIAGETGYHPEHVRYVLRQYGLTPNLVPGQIRRTGEELRQRRERIWELGEEGLTHEEIAKQVGISQSAVSRNMALKPPSEFMRGVSMFRELRERTGLPSEVIAEYLRMPKEQRRRLLEEGHD